MTGLTDPHRARVWEQKKKKEKRLRCPKLTQLVLFGGVYVEIKKWVFQVDCPLHWPHLRLCRSHTTLSVIDKIIDPIFPEGKKENSNPN